MNSEPIYTFEVQQNYNNRGLEEPATICVAQILNTRVRISGFKKKQNKEVVYI